MQNAPAGAALSGADFSWTPTYAQAGSYNVTFTATANGSQDSEIVAITVSNTNRAPVLTAIGAKTASEGAALSFQINGSDPDNDPLTFSASNLPSGATFAAQARTFTWTPAVTDSGIYMATFFARDSGAPQLEAARTVIIHVTDSNRAPTISVTSQPTAVDGIVISDPELTADGSATACNSRLSVDESATSSTVLSIINTNGKVTNLSDFTKVSRVSSMTVPGTVRTYNFKIAEAATGASGSSQYVITMPNYDSNRGAIFKFDRENLRSLASSGSPIDIVNNTSMGIDRFYGSQQGEFFGAGMTFADTDEDGITDLMCKRRDVANSASYIVGLTGGNYMGRAVTVDNNTFSFQMGGQDVDLRDLVITTTAPATTNTEMGLSQGPMIGFGVQGGQTMTVR